MFDRLFLLVYEAVHRHKKRTLTAVVLVTLLFTAILPFIRYEGSIDLMLPPDREITRSMNFLKDSNLSDKMVVSLALTDSSMGKRELFEAVDSLAASLKKPYFKKVMTGFSVGNLMEEFSVLQYGPQILGDEEMSQIAAMLTPENVSKKIKGIYLQSMRPDGIFTASMSRTDPLGIKLMILNKLKAIPASMNFDVSIEDGHFISRDGRHAMLVIQTDVPMMDAVRSKGLVSELEAKLKLLPPYIAADIVSGHLHTVSNEKVIKRDIAVASYIASAAFLILFLGIFRDPKVIFVFIIPFMAVVWSIALATLVEGKLSFLVIGFGTSIAGISIDYGLLVYIAIKRGIDKVRMLKMAKLVTVDAMTTVFSFVVLFFSMIKGYHQLALFSILCVLICLLFSLFVLPLVISVKGEATERDSSVGDRLRNFKWPAKPCIAVWLILSAVALYQSMSVKFDSDLKRFDGTEPRILQMEKNFNTIWGGKDSQAIMVVTGKSLEEAMQLNDSLFKEASARLPKGEFSSLAYFWPSEKTRTENRARWLSFWKDGGEERLKSLIRSSSLQYGFTPEAFTPFFDGLYALPNEGQAATGVMAQLKERYVIERNGSVRLLSFFPDKKEYLDALAPIVKENTFIVSKLAISESMTRFTLKETKLLAPLAILFNILLAWIFFRSWKEALIALVPLFTGVVWFIGIMSFFNVPLNIVNIIAAIISTGVIVDYGLGMTYEYRYNLKLGTVVAVTLSAATNMIGSGALLFANYPALYSTGIAMVVCMVSGYLSSLIIIPSLISLMKPVETK
ncbi:MAG: MMPL family transporter [Geobacteraceae bacterium]|nr:MMPL family transporter [Geobacteraceae bacterium]